MAADDDFDIDVDALAGDEEEPEPILAAPVQPGEAPAEPAPAEAKAMSARKPGLWQQLGDRASAPFARLRLPEWNLKTFAYLLLIIIILWFLLENWPPCRVRLLIWNGEAPKTVLFLVNLVIGAALLRWWQLFMAQRQARKDAAAQAAAAAAEAAPPL
jgi:uncharacterized integral membrane protein